MIDLVSALDEQTAKRIKVFPHPNNRASEAGHPCERFLVLARTQTDKMALHGLDLQRIFDEGWVHEHAVLRELEDARFTVIEQQRGYKWKKFQLSGHIDGLIKGEDGRVIPLEIKSCSPNVFRTIKDKQPEELITAKQAWVRKYPAQVLLYCMMQGAEEGILLFKNKQTGEKCQKTFVLMKNLEYVEGILQKLERVNGHVAAGTVPEVQPIEDCKGCGFAKTVCFPDQEYGPGYEIFTEGGWIAKLTRRAELEEASQEFKELDEEIREAFKGRNAIVGDFKIESKETERKEYVVKAGKFWRTSIERL
jgi:hypothetical protein